MNERSTDVCVVGAGPAGLAVAVTLGEAGRSVTVLESGGWSPSPEAAALSAGDHHGVPYVGLAASRHRQVGGTVNIWNVEYAGEPGAKYAPLSPRDLVDWPIGWDELQRHYPAAQDLCGLGRFEYEAEPWAGQGRRPFDLTGTALTSRVYHFGSALRFTRELPERLARLDRVTLLPSTTVVGWESRGRRIEKLTAVGEDRQTLDLSAEQVVLAGGAVENARLLLIDGLGVRMDWLGRGFMEHARDFSMSLDPASSDVFSSATFYDAHAPEPGSVIGGRLAFTDAALDEHQLPNASLTLFPRHRPSRGLVDRVHRRLRKGRSGRHEGPYGWSAEPDPGAAFDDFKLIMNVEQRPHRHNRIELSDRTDRLGNPLPALHLEWSGEEQRRLDRMRLLVDESLRDAGLGSVRHVEGVPPDLSAHHHAGTTRMAEDPDRGVVDPQGRVFGWDNLHVAGASVFPTAGFANPTLTIVALAIRLARHLDRL